MVKMSTSKEDQKPIKSREKPDFGFAFNLIMNAISIYTQKEVYNVYNIDNYIQLLDQLE